MNIEISENFLNVIHSSHSILIEKTQNSYDNIQIIILLDISGSMKGNMEEMIQSINKFVSDQQKQFNNDNIQISFIQFNDTLFVDKTNLCINLATFPILKEADYKANGSTKLYDAMGTVFDYFEQCKNSVIFTIITDGVDNSSKFYNLDYIKKKINEKQNKDQNNWIFHYLCASLEGFQIGNQMGVISNIQSSPSNLSNIVSSLISLKVTNSINSLYIY